MLNKIPLTRDLPHAKQALYQWLTRVSRILSYIPCTRLSGVRVQMRMAELRRNGPN